MKTKIFSTVFLFLFVITWSSYSAPRKMVLEFCTGTWCGWCPCGDEAAEQILVTYPQTIVIAYHGASTDPWQNFNGNAIRSMLGFAGYPTGIFDRTNHPGNGSSYPWVTYDMWSSYASNRYNGTPNTQINVALTNSSYNVNTRELNTSINATALQDLTGQYKIVYVLTEDNVVYPQNFYAACGTAGYHNDYVHKWIARSVINNPNGENLNTGTWNQNLVISRTVTTILDNAWVAENCHLNIIVYKDNVQGLFLSAVEQGAKLSVGNLVGISGNNNQVPEAYYLS
ncbi:MAG TPA: Omp28-related outer membrane protein [Ignavibacteria bacterium]|jgi:hypothetical protein